MPPPTGKDPASGIRLTASTSFALENDKDNRIAAASKAIAKSR